MSALECSSQRGLADLSARTNQVPVGSQNVKSANSTKIKVTNLFQAKALLQKEEVVEKITASWRYLEDCTGFLLWL